jgi:signal transduction histidine kinase
MHGVLFIAGDLIPNSTLGPPHSRKTLSGEFQNQVQHGPLTPAFPYRLHTWKLEKPSARDTEERLAVATLAADVAIWDLDVRSGSLQWCYRCTEIFGTPFETGRWQQLVLERIHPEDRLRVQHAIEEALDPRGTGVFAVEFRIRRRPDGETRWIASNGRAFFEELEGERTTIRFLGTLLDRTKQKLAHDALVESEKLAVTGRLAVSMAHEIKNPLDSIANILYVLRSEVSAEKRDEHIGAAEAEVAHLNEISSNTLNFYRDPPDGMIVDVAELINSVLKLFRSRISPQQVRVQTEISAGIAVHAPRGEMRQVLVNLIGNALDAMPKGGRLIVRGRELTDKTGNRCVRLTVADTGEGMSSAVLSRIFEAFYTTKKATGTGIGLWLTREIIRKWSCRIYVRSRVSRGTVFILSLAGSSIRQPID